MHVVRRGGPVRFVFLESQGWEVFLFLAFLAWKADRGANGGGKNNPEIKIVARNLLQSSPVFQQHPNSIGEQPFSPSVMARLIFNVEEY